MKSNKTWVKAQILEKTKLTKNIYGLTLKGNNLLKHIPGQFYLLRKVGSFASREYSLANIPNTKSIIEFGIQKIKGGKVSTVLTSLKKSKEIEIKGPLGKYFNWQNKFKGHVIYIAGGAGIVPFMSMIRLEPKNNILLLGSFKTLEDIPYFSELKLLEKKLSNFNFFLTLTQTTEKWSGRKVRINAQYLHEKLNLISKKNLRVFICGRSSFVEDIYKMLLKNEVNEKQIQRERFG